MRFLLLALIVGFLIGSEACAQFVNGGFEDSSAGAPPMAWAVTNYLNDGFSEDTPPNEDELELAYGGYPLTDTMDSAFGWDSQPDANLGPSASLRWPRYGSQCVLINQDGRDQNVNALSQSAVVGPALVDPVDGQMHVCFVVAPVLENPHHAPFQQPYYYIQLTDDTQGILLYSDMGTLDDTNMPWQAVGTNEDEFDFTDWQLVDIAPGTNMAVGDQITITAISSGCSLGGHMGQLYLDGVGTVVPGIFVEATAPPIAFPGENLTYTLTYRSAYASNETGVVLCFNTPPNTTFQSLQAPGLAATLPTVGSNGAVMCSLTNLAAGASGSVSVTVNINPGATGPIMARNYGISSDVETPLLGPKVVTELANIDPIVLSSPVLLRKNVFSFNFTNVPGTSFTILGSTNVALPVSRWTVIGGAAENSPGIYSFTNSASGKGCFYTVISP